jgi:hypothetical protein
VEGLCKRAQVFVDSAELLHFGVRLDRHLP